MRVSCVVYLWLCLLLPAAPRAQPAPPPGGYALRTVALLSPVAEPAGGLVPYRKGRLWGYADTTGRVWIQPCLRLRPPFFAAGVVLVEAEDLRGPGLLPAATVRVVLNAHGDVLPVGLDEAALPDEAGRWRRLNRAEMRGRGPDLARQVASWDTTRLNKFSFSRRRQLLLESYLMGDRYLAEPLGAGLYARSRRLVRTWPYVVVLRATRGREGLVLYPVNKRRGRQALFDERGRRRTRARYVDIQPFSNRRAVYRIMRPLHRRYPSWAESPDRYGYLDPRGRRLTPPRYRRATAFRRGVALVSRGVGAQRQFGLLDTTGRYVVPLGLEPLTEADDAGLVRRRRVRAPADTVEEYLRPDGRPAFPQLVLRQAAAFWRGRAWARTATGLGLLDTLGRWVVPPQYQQLSYPVLTRASRWQQQAVQPRHNDPPTYIRYDDESEAPPDTATLVMRRGRKYGLVARHSGREVAACRYDSVLDAHGGYVCFLRGGQPYVVDGRGRELVQAAYHGQYYDFPGQGRLLEVTRPGLWSIIDSAGRQRVPWLPGRGQYLPEGRVLLLLSREPGSPSTGGYPPGSSLLDSTGRVLWHADTATITATNTVPFFGQGSYGRSWAVVSRSRLAHRDPRPPTWYWVHTERGRDYALDHDLRRLPLPADVELQSLPGGWLLLRKAHWGSNLVELQPSWLRAPDGRLYPAPARAPWQDEPAYGETQQEPFIHGVALSRKGYVTRGGRLLWED